MGTNHSIGKPIVFFDGVCNLCNSSILFIIKRDNKNRFLFASLQSNYAKENLPSEFSVDSQKPSIILKDGDSIYVKSSAVLTVTKSLSGLWFLLYAFMIVPRFIRDGVYDFIASNRYRWFGKKDQCMIPTPELKSRFVD